MHPLALPSAHALDDRGLVPLSTIDDLHDADLDLLLADRLAESAAALRAAAAAARRACVPEPARQPRGTIRSGSHRAGDAAHRY
jgi:hypothetical protein